MQSNNHVNNVTQSNNYVNNVTLQIYWRGEKFVRCAESTPHFFVLFVWAKNHILWGNNGNGNGLERLDISRITLDNDQVHALKF